MFLEDGGMRAAVLTTRALGPALMVVMASDPLGMCGMACFIEVAWCCCWCACVKDIALERKMKTRLGEIRVKQYIPAHKEWLVPSPEVK
eukprot:scaffold46094_cov23-Tisochrysis_lutea.AAC.1